MCFFGVVDLLLFSFLVVVIDWMLCMTLDLQQTSELFSVQMQISNLSKGVLFIQVQSQNWFTKVKVQDL